MSGGGYGSQQWGGQTGGNMYGAQYGGGMDQPMNRSAGFQQPIASQGILNDAMRRAGGMGTSYTPLGPNDGMTGGNMGAPTPMQSAFAPTQGMGGPMPGQSTDTGMAQDLSGKGWGVPSPVAAMDGGSPWGAQTGGNMGAPTPDGFGGGKGYSLTGGLGPNAGMTGGNMGAPQLDGLGSFDPRTGMMMGNAGTGGLPQQGQAGYQPSGAYGDYMNRRNNWINQLRGYVARPQPIGMGDSGGPKPQPKGPAGAGGIDHMANLRSLMGEDPRLANEYRLRNGDTLGWWQQNQGNVAQGLFGGDNAKMQEWLRGTTPTSSNAAPLSQQEMMRLNQMAGIRGPSWMR